MKAYTSYILRRLKPLFVFFLSLELALRIVLLIRDRAQLDPEPLEVVAALLMGVGYDLAVFTYFMLPLVVYLLLLPTRLHGTRADRILTGIFYFIAAYILLFDAVGEWFFWDEFSARFNFIGVD